MAILKPTHIQKLAAENRLPPTPFGLSAPTSQPLPAEKEASKYDIPKLQLPTTDLVKKSNKQLRLRVYYDSLPPTPKEQQPPCESCKTSPCCVAFVVNISKEEYESGFYGDAAVKLTPEIYEQLKNKFLQSTVIGAPAYNEKNPYYLDAKVGDRCPFLTAENRCGIYEIRPATCRVYTCVSDPRITQEMRDGTVPINLFTVFNR
jgi:Fe-S-cluster containining protein